MSVTGYDGRGRVDVAAAGAGNGIREITVRGLLETLWRGWWLLLAVVALCLLVTAVVLKLRTPVYTATMIVAPADTDLGAVSRLASELEQYAGLATLAQTPLKLKRASEMERYAQLFGSTTLAERLQAEQGLLQIVFAEQWDAERQAWRAPSGLFAALEKAVLGFFGFPAWSEPDVTLLAEWLGNQITIQRLAGSALHRIEMDNPSPAFAVEVIGAAHRTADQILRETALEWIGRQIAQIENEIALATSSTRREALQEMLVEQYQAQALLRTDQPYAAQIVVPAAASATPTSTSPILILVLAAVVGVILGVFLVFLRDALR